MAGVTLMVKEMVEVKWKDVKKVERKWKDNALQKGRHLLHRNVQLLDFQIGHHH